jgi:chitin disaccharide deacetylase
MPKDNASALLDTKSRGGPAFSSEPALCNDEMSHSGVLIVNADDWGRDRDTTDRIGECILRRTVSSVSAMVFMEDSERAAEQAGERRIDAGLHLNFTTPFSARHYPPLLAERQQGLARYLLRHRLAQVMFHPGLVRSFEYVVSAQIEEFCRLYGVKPDRVDGHHHMHLCANVLLGRLLPVGTIARRSFSFQPGEKSTCNRFYRKTVDRRLSRYHHLVDFLFSLPPLEPADRLQRIFSFAREHAVELETHPVNAEEYRFLAEGEFSRRLGDLTVAPRFAWPRAARSNDRTDEGLPRVSE